MTTALMIDVDSTIPNLALMHKMNSTAFGNDTIVALRLWDLIPGARAVTWLTS